MLSTWSATREIPALDFEEVVVADRTLELIAPEDLLLPVRHPQGHPLETLAPPTEEFAGRWVRRGHRLTVLRCDIGAVEASLP